MALDNVWRKESMMADLNETLKNTRYLWLYSSENLADRDREECQMLKNRSEGSTVYAIKDNLRKPWNYTTEKNGIIRKEIALVGFAFAR